MPLNRRRFLHATAGMSGLAALAACGSNTGRSSSGELRQWYHEYGEHGVEDAVKRYASNYKKTKVDVQWQVGTQYNSKIAAALLTDNGPDVFEWQLNVEMVLGDHPQVVPLDDLIADVREDFVPATLDANTVNGKLYGIPEVEDMQLLYYRKSLLSKAKVTPPQTVDELVEAARATTTDKVKGLFVGNDAGASVLGGPALWSAGLDYVKPDHTIAFDSSRAETVLAKLHTMYANNSTLRQSKDDWSSPTAFINGEVAMQWTGLWAMPDIKDKWQDDFDVLPFPKLDGQGAPAVPIGTFAAMVNAKSDHVDEAKAYVKWLWVDQTEDQKDFNTSYGFHLPPRKSIASQASTLKSGPAATAAMLSKNYAHSATPPDWTPTLQTGYSDALVNIIAKGSSPAKEMDKLRSKAKAELKKIYS